MLVRGRKTDTRSPDNVNGQQASEMAPTVSSLRTRTRLDGTHYVQVLWRERGKQRTTSFDSPDTATRWRKLLDQVGPERAREIIGATENHTPLLTLTQWCESYIDGLTGVEDGTRRRYHSYLRMNITPSIGALPLTSITDTTIARWVHSLHGASGKTIKNKHGFLSGALAAAVKAGHITVNPCEGMRLPRTEREDMCFLTPSDYAVLLGYVPIYWQPLVTVLISTGMRWSEVTALQVRDVDTDRCTVRIARAWKYTSGQGHRLGPPKSRRSERTLSLAEETMDLLRPLLHRPGTEFLFSNTRGNPVRHATFHDNVWAPAVRLANGEKAGKSKRIARRCDALGHEILPATDVKLNKRPRIHDLRHSHASWLINAGIALPVIQQRLGHESITTTVNTYGHLDASSMVAATAAVSRALTQALPRVLPAALTTGADST